MAHFSWFTSPGGRKFSMSLAITASVGSFCAFYTPHTFFLNYYKKFVQMYSMGKDVPITETIKKRFDEVLDDLDATKYERVLIKPFTVYGFDIFHAGMTFSRFGGILGIPVNYTYTDISSINTTPILLNNAPVDWSEPDAKILLDSLVLSENAQKFAIAHEVLRLRNMDPFFNGIASAAIIVGTYIASNTMNKKFNMFNKPPIMRYIFYCLVGFFSVSLWIAQKDILMNYYESDADKTLARLGPQYVNGGQEFYSKILERNKALRKLLGEQGEKTYTVSGNENFMIRQKRLPLVHRKSFFDSVMQKEGEKEAM